EAVLRKLEGQVDVVTASDFLAAHPPRSTIRLPEGSWGQGGHHWVWLNDGTRWIWEDVYRAEDAFLDVLRATRSRKDPTVRRIVAQLARELLLLESSDWPFLVTTVAAKDYAEARVKEHIGAFDRLRAMLERLKEGTLPPDDASWLTFIEERDSLFSDVNPELWTLESLGSMSTLSFHFHGYQPGDTVRWREPDPLRPQRIEERHSPVVLRIGPDRIEGRNWTDAVLRTYGRMGSVLGRAEGSASSDIEPQTLTWLLERDPSAYREIVAAYDAGTAGFVMTPPFHPILPHLHRQEREALFDMMIDFYSPLIRRSAGRPIGLWLPEACYSRETM